MTLIERMAKQEDNPCLLCKYGGFCSSEIRRKCLLNKKWRDFRHQAYKQHIAWCVKMMSFKEE